MEEEGTNIIGEDLESVFKPEEVIKSATSFGWRFFLFWGEDKKKPDKTKVNCTLCKKVTSLA